MSHLDMFHAWHAIRICHAPSEHETAVHLVFAPDLRFLQYFPCKRIDVVHLRYRDHDAFFLDACGKKRLHRLAYMRIRNVEFIYIEFSRIRSSINRVAIPLIRFWLCLDKADIVPPPACICSFQRDRIFLFHTLQSSSIHPSVTKTAHQNPRVRTLPQNRRASRYRS